MKTETKTKIALETKTRWKRKVIIVRRNKNENSKTKFKDKKNNVLNDETQFESYTPQFHTPLVSFDGWQTLSAAAHCLLLAYRYYVNVELCWLF